MEAFTGEYNCKGRARPWFGPCGCDFIVSAACKSLAAPPLAGVSQLVGRCPCTKGLQFNSRFLFDSTHKAHPYIEPLLIDTFLLQQLPVYSPLC